MWHTSLTRLHRTVEVCVCAVRDVPVREDSVTICCIEPASCHWGSILYLALGMILASQHSNDCEAQSPHKVIGGNRGLKFTRKVIAWMVELLLIKVMIL